VQAPAHAAVLPAQPFVALQQAGELVEQQLRLRGGERERTIALPQARAQLLLQGREVVCAKRFHPGRAIVVAPRGRGYRPRPLALAPPLLDAVARALDRRRALLDELRAEGTDALRLFHGIAEGEPGLAIDRYGPLLLVQTFRAPLSHDDVEQLGAFVGDHVGDRFDGALLVCGNHRGSAPPPGFPLHEPSPAALQEQRCRERGLSFAISGRHRGQDPWLFLDLRPARAFVHAHARDRTVLNLFAYTCGVGVMAAAGGAHRVLNVDFAQGALAVGARNAAQNGVDGERFRQLESDCIPVLRQLARLPVQRRGRARAFARIEPQPFDLVVLDPPRWAKGPFGAVDVARDYESLWKPCVLTLADGGIAVATNHVPEVSAETWCERLRRCASKAGRPLRDLQLLAPAPDFPSFDGRPPLKIAVARL
jgi:23S rRNA (cytosine1962-C5)-methyltransferase